MMIIDLTRFFDALKKLYPEDQRIAVRSLLVVGPGYHEAIADLLTFFSNACLTLIDVDEKAISHLGKELASEASRLTLLAGDANHLLDLAPGPYDLVVIRHPDIARYSERWRMALQTCVTITAIEGLLVLTAYSLPEASFINQVMEESSVALIPGSPYTASPVSLQGNDRYILAYQRSS